MHKINTRLVKMMKAVELVIAVLLMIAIAISTLADVYKRQVWNIREKAGRMQ